MNIFNFFKTKPKPVSQPKEVEFIPKATEGRQLNFLTYEEYLLKQSIINVPKTDEEIILTYDEVIKFMSEFVKPESREWQIARVNSRSLT